MAGRGNKKVSIKASNNKWLVAAYARRSFDDNEDIESNTIANQKDMIDAFISKEKDMTIIDYYSDDGYSGTTFNRPSFQRMMKEIKDGTINTIIVKDLSRLGRNYLEVGKYIEEIFPIYNVRIIAIQDNIDSFYNPESIDNLLVPIKNLINESYARDISEKVSSTFYTMARNGKFISGTAPYGYAIDKNDKHKLVIDPEEAEIIKLIFDMALKGNGRVKIVKYLNDNFILCRKEIQRRNKYKIPLDSIDEPRKSKWNTTTIGRILKNETYIGNLAQIKTKVENFKTGKVVDVDEKDWIRCENTHEPIISKEDFKKVQEIISSNLKHKKEKPKNFSIYNGILKCADCKKAMLKQEDFRGKRKLSNYFCSTYLYLSNKSCSSHKIETEKLDDIVLKTIQLQINLIIELDRSLKKLYLKNNRDTVESEYKNNIRLAEIKINNLNNKKISLYEDWKFNNIDRNEYNEKSKQITDDLLALEESIKLITQTYRENIRMLRKNDHWVNHFKRNKKITKLTKEVLKELIEVIYIDKNGNVDIHFKYNDEYVELIKYLEKEGAVKECQSGELVYI